MGTNKQELVRLEGETAQVLPERDLMITISLLGIPLLEISDVNVNLDTAGPNWLAGLTGG